MSTAVLEKQSPSKARDDEEILRLVSFNRGDKALYDDLFGILTDVPGTDLPVDVAVLSEMFAPRLKPILKRLESHGFGVFYGDLEGARADPIVWNPERLRLQDSFCYKLLPAATRDGKRNMQKNLNGGRYLFKPARRSIVVAGAHAIQTNSKGKRHAAALEMNHEIFDILNKRRVATFLGGDFNTRPESDLLAPFHKGGWQCTQLGDQQLPTHQKRAIDQWWWDDKDAENVARFLRQYTRDGASDHKALYAEFAIKVRAA